MQYRKATEQECFAQKKVIGRIISKHYLKNIKENTDLVLEHEGFFRHPLEIDLYEKFVPWLYDEIANELKERD